MVHIDKENQIKKSKVEKNKASTEQRNLIWIEDEEEESSSSSMSMYNLDLDGEDSNIPSHQSPIVIVHDAPLPIHLEEVHSSPIMEKVPSERHSMVQEEDHPSSSNIEEIFGAFTFQPP